jgi:hypothetical protein
VAVRGGTSNLITNSQARFRLTRQNVTATYSQRGVKKVKTNSDHNATINDTPAVLHAFETSTIAVTTLRNQKADSERPKDGIAL